MYYVTARFSLPDEDDAANVKLVLVALKALVEGSVGGDALVDLVERT